MILVSLLTTVDNPYDPFDQWNEWFNWDLISGYNTPSLLDRVVKNSESLSEPDQRLAIEQAIDEIVKLNASGRHRKVSRMVEV